MVKAILIILLFLVFSASYNFSLKAQVETNSTKSDSTETTSEVSPTPVEKEIALSETAKILCVRWDLAEYRENGKVQELPNYEIEFFSNGKYNALEETDYDEGFWTLSNDNSKIIFDEGTKYQEEWNIISIDAKMFKVKFNSERIKYEYTFVPFVEWKP